MVLTSKKTVIPKQKKRAKKNNKLHTSQWVVRETESSCDRTPPHFYEIRRYPCSACILCVSLMCQYSFFHWVVFVLMFVNSAIFVIGKPGSFSLLFLLNFPLFIHLLPNWNSLQLFTSTFRSTYLSFFAKILRQKILKFILMVVACYSVLLNTRCFVYHLVLCALLLVWGHKSLEIKAK